MSWRWIVLAVFAAIFAFVPTGALSRGLRELWLTWRGKCKNLKNQD